MGHRIETRRRHESSSSAVEMNSSLAYQTSKFTDKYKIESTINRPNIGMHHDLSKPVNQNVVQLTPPKTHQNLLFGSKENNDDELVKYMSNLPGYLQKGKNVQEKALNFGVLDWERLEKWKYNERMPPSRSHRKTSSVGGSSFVAGRPPAAYDVSSRRKQVPSPAVSSGEIKLAEPVQLPQPDFTQTTDSQTNWCPPKYQKPKHRVGKEISTQRFKSEQKIGKHMDSDPPQMMRQGKGDLSSELIKNVSVPSARINIIRDSKHGIELDNEVNLTSQNFAAEPKNIVILVPKHRPKTSMGASQFSEPRTSFDEQPAEAMRTRLSNCSSQESSFTEPHTIPHSCPLPNSFAANTEPHMKQHQLSNVQGINSDLWSPPSQNERITTRSSFDAKCLKNDKCDAELGVPDATSQRMDLDTAEQTVVKGRHPSPNKRFSFSLSRMSRSFSFKESSAVSPLNSTTTVPKSGPVGPSSSVDISHREKPNAGARGRSSPLRRLLDPLLRPKGGHSTETFPLPSGNSNGKTLPANHTKHHVKKHQPSTLQALLQLTLKDGVPFFKLVVDDDGGILAAAVKKLPTSGKGGNNLVYAFYAVHEIRKKSGSWMSHGPKEKTAGFGYKVIGQMDISCSKVPDSSINDHENTYVQRESVLYTIDSGQVDKQASNSSRKRELAAVVVMNSSQNELYADSSQEGSEACSDIVVILPGATHSLPNDGAPSSLLQRWRSGGLCDCGGWDVGCKLKVLEKDKSCRSQDYLNLFIQGGDHRSKPIFSMAPLKNGLYSIEFDSSIPLLEAFSICVSALTSNKLADIFEVGPLGQKAFSDVASVMKTSSIVQGQAPQRYVSSPPASPVGRI